MHSASDKHSHAFARYVLLAAIGIFSSQSSRGPSKLIGSCLRPPGSTFLLRLHDEGAPPADPAAGRKQRRRMLSAALPQASAGTALSGRAVLGPLDDASRLVPPREPSPGFASLCRQCDRGQFRSGGEGQCFCRTGMQGRPTPLSPMHCAPSSIVALGALYP
jgi:hypothetical protein